MLGSVQNLNSSKQSSELVSNRNNLTLNPEQTTDQSIITTLVTEHEKTLEEIHEQLTTLLNEQEELAEESSRIEKQKNELIAENLYLRTLLDTNEPDKQQLLKTIQESERQITCYVQQIKESVRLQSALQADIDRLQQQLNQERLASRQKVERLQRRVNEVRQTTAATVGANVRNQEQQLAQQRIQQERLAAQQQIEQERLAADQRVAHVRNITNIIQTNIAVLEKSVEVIQKIFERCRINRNFIRSNYDSSRPQVSLDIDALRMYIQEQKDRLNGSVEGILNSLTTYPTEIAINHPIFMGIRNAVTSLKEFIIEDKQKLESHLPSNNATYSVQTSNYGSITFTGPNGFLNYLDSWVRGYTAALDAARVQLQKEYEDDGCTIKIVGGILSILVFPVGIQALVNESNRIPNAKQKVDELELELSRRTNARAKYAEKLERFTEAQRMIDLANAFLACSNKNEVVNFNLEAAQQNNAVAIA